MKTSFYYGVAALALISACPALAQEAPKASGNDTITEVVVLGHGQARQTQQIKAAELLQATPGTSPLKVLDKLPGVTFQSADPFGAYEWSTRISVRGFNQNQMGFTLDGITLGDMSYGNYNGLHISRHHQRRHFKRRYHARGRFAERSDFLKPRRDLAIYLT